MEEVFKQVPDSGYFVSNLGRVKNLSGKILKTNASGYTQLLWKSGGKKTQKYLHRIVHELFNGTIPEGYQINHIDGDKTNNGAKNLEAVTCRENAQKARALGLSPKVTRQKLSHEQVRTIKKRLLSGEMARYIAPDYGVSEITIGDIKTGRTWSWLS